MIRNIYQRKDGRYEGRVTLAYQGGKRQYKAFFGKDEDEVAAKMSEFRLASVSMPCVSITFGTAFAEWFQSNSIRTKESTQANYRLKAEKHILPVFENTMMTDITQQSLYQFIKDKQASGLSNRYIADILVLMKSVFKYAARTYHIFNPMEGLVMPKKEKTEILLLTAEQEKRLMRILLATSTLTTLGIVLARMLGLRIGELCALQWKNIDLEKRILTVSKTLQRIQVKGSARKTKIVITDPKSETSKRNIPIPECIIELLRQFQG